MCNYKPNETPHSFLMRTQIETSGQKRKKTNKNNSDRTMKHEQCKISQCVSVSIPWDTCLWDRLLVSQALCVSQMSTTTNASTLDLCANAPTEKSMKDASMADSSWFTGEHAPSRVTVQPSSPAHLIGGEVSLMDSLSTDNFSAVSSSLIWKWRRRMWRPSTRCLLSLPFLLIYISRWGRGGPRMKMEWEKAADEETQEGVNDAWSLRWHLSHCKYSFS